MVGLNIPVTVEVLPESLRKISRDINASVSSLSPEFNIDTGKIKQAVAFGLQGQSLEIEGLSARAKELIGRELNQALVGRIDRLVVTADAKRDVAREIQTASENVDILLDIDKIKSDFAEATKEARDLFNLSESAAENLTIVRRRADEAKEAFETERDRPTRLGNLPQQGGSARFTENLNELRNLDKLDEEAKKTASDLSVFQGVLKDIGSSFEKASIDADELGSTIEGVADTSLEEEQAKLANAFGRQFKLVDRESKQFQQSIQNKIRSSKALRSLTGSEERAARVAAAGVTDAESLRDARSKLASILANAREQRNRGKIVELIDEERKLKGALNKEVAASKLRTQAKNKANRAQADKLIANIGRNIANKEKARLKAINDSIKAFTKQTGEVLKGADAQKQLFAKIRKTLSNTTAEGGGRGLGDTGGIQGAGSLQNFAEQLDPQQLRAFQGALSGINKEVDNYGRSLNDSNAANVKFGTLNSKNTKGTKSFGASLREMRKSATLAFKRLLLYTVISQIIFGLVKSVKEAVVAVIELDTQARRLQFFANISKDIASETERVNASITTLQSSFDAVTNTAIRFGIGIKEATEALVTVARVGQDVVGTFSDTVVGLVRLEGGALGAETAVRNLNAIQEQFLRGLDEYAIGANAAAVASGKIGREANLSAALIKGLGATIAVTAAQSSLNVSELSDVVARVGAAFSNLQGTDPVTLISLIGKAASVSGANVGRLATGLKQAATLIIQNAEDIESLTGVKVFDQGSVRGLPAILEVLNAANKAGGSRQRAILGQLFDRRSLDVGAALAAAVGEITKETGRLASAEDIANRVRDNTIKFLEGQANVAGGLDAALNRLDVTVKAIVANEEFTRFLGLSVNLFTTLISKTVEFLAPLNRMGEFIDGTSSSFKILGDIVEFITFNFDGFITLLSEFSGAKTFITIIEKFAEVINLFVTGVGEGTAITELFQESLNGLADVAGLAIKDTIDITALLVGSGFQFLGTIAAAKFGTGLLIGLGTISPIFAAAIAVFGGDSESKLAGLGKDLGDKFTKQFTDAIQKSAGAFISIAEGREKASAATKESNRLEGERQKLASLAFFEAQKEKAAAANRERVLIEQGVNSELAKRAQLIRDLSAAQGENNKTIEIENALRLNAKAIFAAFDDRQQGLRALAQERVKVEREIVLEQQNQASELEKLNNLATILSSNLSKEQKLQLDIDISTVEFSKKIKAAEIELKRLTKVAVLSALSEGDDGSAVANVQKKERELVSLKRAEALKAFDLQKQAVSIAFDSSNKQIEAWESAANNVASAFKKVVDLQKGLADIFNKAGELASQRLKTTASNINAFLERTGASIETRLAAARQQSAAQLALLERNGRRQIDSLERTAGSDTFGTEEQVQADTNRLIDAIIAANQVAQNEIVNQETKSINIEAVARRQVAGELRAEFELRVNATRNEIAVRQRLIGQEIALLQAKISSERKFAELREDQQRSFGRLLINSPEKFAQTLKDFNFSKTFFEGIKDIDLGGLGEIQGRFAQVLKQFGSGGIERLAKGLESAIKFGLGDVIKGIGNEQLLSIIERTALLTPSAIDKQIKKQQDIANKNTEEQKRVKLLQEKQRQLIDKDVKIQEAQIRLALLDTEIGRVQRDEIIRLLGKELAAFELANEKIAALTNTLTEGRKITTRPVEKTEPSEDRSNAIVDKLLNRKPFSDEVLGAQTNAIDGLNEAVKEFTKNNKPKKEEERPPRPITPRTERPPTPGVPFPNSGRPVIPEPLPLPTPPIFDPPPLPEIKGSDEVARVELERLLELEKQGQKLNFEQLARLQKALRESFNDGAGTASFGAQIRKDIIEALKRAGLSEGIRPTPPRREPIPAADFDPITGKGLTQKELDDIFGGLPLQPSFPGRDDKRDANLFDPSTGRGLTEEELRELEPTPKREEGPALPSPSERFDPATGRGLFQDELDAIAEGLGRQTAAAIEAAQAAKVAAEAAKVAAEAVKAAAEARAAQDAADKKFINESPIFKEEDKAEILSISEKLARSIADGVNEALLNGGTVLGEKIAEQINGQKIEIEIPETVIRVELDGRITTELNGDKFFAELTTALEGTGLNIFQIEAIKRRIVDLTKNQRDAGANVPFNGEIDN